MVKTLFLITFLLMGFGGIAQNLYEIRSQYPNAKDSEELTTELDDALSGVSTSSSAELIAYKGAVKTLRAKFAKKIRDKKSNFKEGVEWIESVIKADPENIEIRYLRLSVQEHAPKFLKYHDNISEDKNYILKEHSSISDTSLQAVIQDFMMRSENFEEE